MEIQWRGGSEDIPVREEIVEDDARMISLAVVPTLKPISEDTMESEEEGSRESMNPTNI